METFSPFLKSRDRVNCQGAARSVLSVTVAASGEQQSGCRKECVYLCCFCVCLCMELHCHVRVLFMRTSVFTVWTGVFTTMTGPLSGNYPPNHINLTNRPGSSKYQLWRGSESRLVPSSSPDMAQETIEPLAHHQRRSRSNAEHAGIQSSATSNLLRPKLCLQSLSPGRNILMLLCWRQAVLTEFVQPSCS